MPRDIPTYTVCKGPGEAKSDRQIGGLAGVLIRAFFANKPLTIGAFLAVLVGLVVVSNPIGWLALGAAIIIGLMQFKDWYYNYRLLCIRDRDCAIGTIISKPTVAFDGDRKLNLMLIPYYQRDCVDTLLDHIADNEAMLIESANFDDPPFHTSAPALPTLTQRENDFGILRGYMRSLRSKDPSDEDAEANMYRQLLVGVVHRLLADPSRPNRDFYNRYYRKDPVHIPEGGALWGAIPDDFDATVDWLGSDPQSLRTHDNPYTQKEDQALNPMFRFDISHLVPFLHCEIEGYRMALFLDDLILAFATWLAATLALWPFLGPVAPLAAFFIAAVVFLFKSFIDKITRNEGKAEEPDTDWDDLEVPDQGVTEQVGDVAAVYGNWIMDTEHWQYFEIHPVRAYYLVARNSIGVGPVLVNGNMEQEEFDYANFDPAEVTSERADNICRIVTGAEEEEPPVVIERRADTLLSYGLTMNYAGGGAQEPLR